MITGRILRTEETTDGLGNIVIVVEYSDDGKVIVPEWTYRINFQQLIGMTSDEISEFLRINIEHQIGNLIKAKLRSAINANLKSAIESLKGVKIYQTDKVEIPMEASKVITTPYIVTLNADGTITTDRVAAEG